MKYRVVCFDGCNGWVLGEVVEAEEAHRRAARSRNADGLLESEEGDELFVPLAEEGFERDPVCENAGDPDELDEEEDLFLDEQEERVNYNARTEEIMDGIRESYQQVYGKPLPE
jgi:hypothetical protein